MSAARNSSYKFRGMAVTLLYRYRTSSSPSPLQDFQYYHHHHHRDFSSSKKLIYGAAAANYYMNHQELRFISGISTKSEADHSRKPEFDMVKDVQPPKPPYPNLGISTWVKWLLGFVMSILLPLWEQKWPSLRQLEGKMEMVVGEVEEVAEVVEKVATVAEKISENVADQLPDNSMIKEAALAVEHISNVVVADAQLTHNFILKVEDLKQDFEDLETMIEPVICNIIKSEVKPQKIEVAGQLSSKIPARIK